MTAGARAAVAAALAATAGVGADCAVIWRDSNLDDFELDSLLVHGRPSLLLCFSLGDFYTTALSHKPTQLGSCIYAQDVLPVVANVSAYARKCNRPCALSALTVLCR